MKPSRQGSTGTSQRQRHAGGRAAPPSAASLHRPELRRWRRSDHAEGCGPRWRWRPLCLPGVTDTVSALDGLLVALPEAQRILDRAPRRLLDARLDGDAIRAAAGTDDGTLDYGDDEGAPLVERQRIPIATAEGGCGRGGRG